MAPDIEKLSIFGGILAALGATLKPLWNPTDSLGAPKCTENNKQVVPEGVLARILEKNIEQVS